MHYPAVFNFLTNSESQSSIFKFYFKRLIVYFRSSWICFSRLLRNMYASAWKRFQLKFMPEKKLLLGENFRSFMLARKSLKYVKKKIFENISGKLLISFGALNNRLTQLSNYRSIIFNNKRF